MEAIQHFSGKIPILGVCLGHQAIGEAFSGKLKNLTKVYHGIETPIMVVDEEEPLFRDIPSTFQGGRYHSWVVKTDGLPDCLKVTAVDEEEVIMAFTHDTYNVRGVQFHPESIMTAHGKKMLENFLVHCAKETVLV